MNEKCTLGSEKDVHPATKFLLRMQCTPRHSYFKLPPELTLGGIQLLRYHEMTRISTPTSPLIALVQFWQSPSRKRSDLFISLHPPFTKTVNCVILLFHNHLLLSVPIG